MRSLFKTAVAAMIVVASGTFSQLSLAEEGEAENKEARLLRGESVIQRLNNGESQETLEKLRREFPFLADAIQAYALGDVWARPVLDDRARQLAAVSAFAALGNLAVLKVHARYALNAGVTAEELKEIIYLTTVHAGFPRAIDGARALSEVLVEREPPQAK